MDLRAKVIRLCLYRSGSRIELSEEVLALLKPWRQMYLVPSVNVTL